VISTPTAASAVAESPEAARRPRALDRADRRHHQWNRRRSRRRPRAGGAHRRHQRRPMAGACRRVARPGARHVRPAALGCSASGLDVGASRFAAHPGRGSARPAPACTLSLVVAGAWTSHRRPRSGHRATLMALDALHQLAAAVWIGGLFTWWWRRSARSSAVAAAAAQGFRRRARRVGVLITAASGSRWVTSAASTRAGNGLRRHGAHEDVILAGLLVLARRTSSPCVVSRANRRCPCSASGASWKSKLGLGITVLFAARR